MQADALFDDRLTALRRRVRLLSAERTALAAGAWAAAVCLLLAALDKFRVVHVELAWLGAIVGGGLVAGWIWGFARRLGNFEVARAAESRLSLKERLSSAVALRPLAPREPMVSALVEDAEGHLASVQPSRLFPRRLGRRGQVFVGVLVLLAAAMVLPEIPAFQSKATRRERGALRKEGERLVKLARRLEKPEGRPDMKAEKILKQVALNMEALGKDIKTARAGRKEALVRLNKLEKQVKLAQSELGASKGGKSLAQAAAEMSRSQEALSEARMAEKAGLLAKAKAYREGKAGTGAEKELTEEQIKALEKLAASLKPSQAQQMLNMDAELASVLAELLAKKDTQAALEILKRLSEKLENPDTLRKLTDEERKQLAEEMRKLAEALKNTDLDALAKQLLELAKALERGDIKLCQRCAGKLGGT